MTFKHIINNFYYTNCNLSFKNRSKKVPKGSKMDPIMENDEISCIFSFYPYLLININFQRFLTNKLITGRHF